MADDFKTRRILGGGKVVTRKGSKYEADIQNEAKILRRVAAKDSSEQTKKFWSDKDKAEGVGASIVADRVQSTKLEGDYSKKIGRPYKTYDQRQAEDREFQAYSERGSKETTGRKDYPFFKHSEKNNMKGKKK